jgi:hypothetical protein
MGMLGWTGYEILQVIICVSRWTAHIWSSYLLIAHLFSLDKQPPQPLQSTQIVTMAKSSTNIALEKEIAKTSTRIKTKKDEIAKLEAEKSRVLQNIKSLGSPAAGHKAANKLVELAEKSQLINVRI